MYGSCIILEIITHVQSICSFCYTKEGKLYTSFSTESDESTMLMQQAGRLDKNKKH